MMASREAVEGLADEPDHQQHAGSAHADDQQGEQRPASVAGEVAQRDRGEHRLPPGEIVDDAAIDQMQDARRVRDQRRVVGGEHEGGAARRVELEQEVEDLGGRA